MNVFERKQTRAEGCVREKVFLQHNRTGEETNECLSAENREPGPLKVNFELISAAYSGLPRAELSNQSPAERSYHNLQI